MSNEEAKSLPTITRMPIIKPEVWERIRAEFDQGGEGYLWSLGANIARTNPEQRESYEEALREPPPESPDATAATVILVLRALDIQAKNDGFQLPEIPSPINPRPALREFIPFIIQARDRLSALMDHAYKEMLKTNPVIGKIVQDIAGGAPDELNRIATEVQARSGAVYAYYGVKAAIPRT